MAKNVRRPPHAIAATTADVGGRKARRKSRVQWNGAAGGASGVR